MLHLSGAAHPSPSDFSNSSTGKAARYPLRPAAVWALAHSASVETAEREASANAPPSSGPAPPLPPAAAARAAPASQCPTKWPRIPAPGDSQPPYGRAWAGWGTPAVWRKDQRRRSIESDARNWAFVSDASAKGPPGSSSRAEGAKGTKRRRRRGPKVEPSSRRPPAGMGSKRSCCSGAPRPPGCWRQRSGPA
eukprot:scaffold276506_cov32-Tisochrysis_lutea.AAC.6